MGNSKVKVTRIEVEPTNTPLYRFTEGQFAAISQDNSTVFSHLPPEIFPLIQNYLPSGKPKFL